MPLYTPDNRIEWLANGTLPTGAHVQLDGTVVLQPDDLSPSRNWLDLNASGMPLGWDCILPPNRRGFHAYSTTRNYQRSGITRQTLAPMLYDRAAWVANELIVVGPSPIRSKRGADVSPLPAPPAPIVTKVNLNDAGLVANTGGNKYQAAYGFADERGKRTTISGFTEADAQVANGQGLTFYMPEGVRNVAPYLDWYLTDETGDPTTARLHRRIRLEHFAGSTYDYGGAYREHGQIPPTENHTNLGKPRKPHWGEHTEWAYVINRHGVYKLQYRQFRFALSMVSPRGGGVISDFTDIVQPAAIRNNRAIHFHLPRKSEVPDGWGIIPWVAMAPEGKKESLYRVYPRKGNKEGKGFVFWRDDPDWDEWRDNGLSIYGYLPRKEQKGGAPDVHGGEPKHLQYGLAKASRPEGDGTGIEAPDPSQGPEAPTPFGLTLPFPGFYYAAVSDEDENGKESLVSPTAPKITITTGQGFRVKPSSRINKLENPEGADRTKDTGSANYIQNWTRTNTGNADTFKVFGGRFVLDSTVTRDLSALGNMPLWESDPIQVKTDQVTTVTGTVVCNRYNAGSNGTAQIVIVEYDDSNAVLNRSAVAGVASVGAKNPGPYGKTIGPAAITTDYTYNSATAYITLQFRLFGSTTNMNAWARDMGVFFFNGALRKYDDGKRTDPADPNPGPASAYPEQSSVFVGPAPSPVNPSVSSGIAPVNADGFETGGYTLGANIADGSTFTGWTFNRTGTSTTSTVEANTNLLGAQSWRVQDANANAGATKGVIARSRTFTGSEMGNQGRGAMAALTQVIGLPTADAITIGEIGSSVSTNTMARVKLYPEGAIRLAYVDSKGAETVVSGVNNIYGNVSGSAGTIIDWEVILTGGDSKNGTIRLLVGLNGKTRREVNSISGCDLTGRNPRTFRQGILAPQNSRTVAQLRFDTVVITLGGDVLDRFTPQANSTAALSPPDRPPKPTVSAWAAATPYNVNDVRRPTAANGHFYKVIAKSGTGTSAASQPTWPTESGATVIDNPGANQLTWQEAGSSYREFDVNGEEINQMWLFIEDGVTPSDDYGPLTTRSIPVTPGSTYTHAIFGAHSVFVDSDNPPAPFTVTLSGPDVEDLEMGSPYGGSQNPAALLQGRVDWLEYVNIFTIPAGYYQADITSQNMRGGVYRWQEPLFALGSLTTVTARDAARDYGRATGPVTIKYKFDTRSRQGELTPAFGENWTDLGWEQGKMDVSAGNTITGVSWRTSYDGVNYSSSITDNNVATVKESPVLEVSATLTGDGVDTPHVHHQGLFLETRTTEAVLLNARRQHLPGKIMVGQVPTFYESPDYTVTTADGIPIASALPGDIPRLGPFTLMCFTADAVQYLKELSPNNICYLEDPFADGGGVVYKIRLYDILEVEENNMGQMRVYNGSRRVAAVSEAPGAYVVDRADMNPKRA